MTHLDHLRDDVRDLTEAGGLLDRLELALDGQAVTAGPSGGHRKVSGSPAPWNDRAAGALLDIVSWSRDAEQTLRYMLSGYVRPTRGGSNGNTGEALRSLVRLAEAADDVTQKRLRSELGNLVRRAMEVLGDADPWTPLPAAPGCAPPACPYCECYSLRMARRRGLVRCTSPGCQDADGNPPAATMETGAYSGTPQLVWADGTSMIFVFDEDTEQEAS